jgi:tRNA G18 (ribose-2'-O)-methylase SpoU
MEYNDTLQSDLFQSGRLLRIIAASDDRITEFFNIRERDLTRHSGQFIAEGKVVLQHLIGAMDQGSNFSVTKVLVLENRVSGLLPLLARMPEHIPIFVADRGILDEIAGFPMHRGVLALGQYDTAKKPIATKDAENQLVLVASGISNHDNLGSIFRNAAAFGVDRILLDKTCCHPLYRKSIRVSVGSVLTVPFEMGLTLADIVAQLKDEGFALYGLSPNGQMMIDDVTPNMKSALMLGTEGEGLPVAILSDVTSMKIPQAEGLDSLNVATASGIALWQFSRSMKRV